MTPELKHYATLYALIIDQFYADLAEDEPQKFWTAGELAVILSRDTDLVANALSELAHEGILEEVGATYRLSDKEGSGEAELTAAVNEAAKRLIIAEAALMEEQITDKEAEQAAETYLLDAAFEAVHKTVDRRRLDQLYEKRLKALQRFTAKLSRMIRDYDDAGSPFKDSPTHDRLKEIERDLLDYVGLL